MLQKVKNNNLLARQTLPKAMYIHAEQILAKEKDNKIALDEKELAQAVSLAWRTICPAASRIRPEVQFAAQVDACRKLCARGRA